MKEIKIKHGYDFVNGGCNACPTFKEDIYSLELNGVDRVLEELNLEALIMAVAMANGYKLHQEYDAAEDYDVYKKEDNEISVIPEYDKLIFKKGSLQLKVANHYQEKEELFAVANNILTQYFEIESLKFVIETQE